MSRDRASLSLLSPSGDPPATEEACDHMLNHLFSSQLGPQGHQTLGQGHSQAAFPEMIIANFETAGLEKR